MSNLASHLFVSSTDGALYDTRAPGWNGREPLRKDYERHFPHIENAAQLKATLRAGGFTSLGGYPLYFLTADGAALSFASVKENLAEILGSLAIGDRRSGWHVVACGVNWEDSELFCDHSNEKIPSAYGRD